MAEVTADIWVMTSTQGAPLSTSRCSPRICPSMRFKRFSTFSLSLFINTPAGILGDWKGTCQGVFYLVLSTFDDTDKTGRQKIEHPLPAERLNIREPLRRLKIELVTLGAIVLRFGVLLVAQIAIQLRSVMRRRVRVARLTFLVFSASFSVGPWQATHCSIVRASGVFGLAVAF